VMDNRDVEPIDTTPFSADFSIDLDLFEESARFEFSIGGRAIIVPNGYLKRLLLEINSLSEHNAEDNGLVHSSEISRLLTMSAKDFWLPGR